MSDHQSILARWRLSCDGSNPAAARVGRVQGAFWFLDARLCQSPGELNGIRWFVGCGELQQL